VRREPKTKKYIQRFYFKLKQLAEPITNTNLLASEHMRTTCFFGALNTLKKTGVYSSRCLEDSVNSPKGPTPP
jgi:hypothetical protein